MSRGSARSVLCVLRGIWFGEGSFDISRTMCHLYMMCFLIGVGLHDLVMSLLYSIELTASLYSVLKLSWITSGCSGLQPGVLTITTPKLVTTVVTNGCRVAVYYLSLHV